MVTLNITKYLAMLLSNHSEEGHLKQSTERLILKKYTSRFQVSNFVLILTKVSSTKISF